MINLIIFSKDRASQLELLIKSIKEYFVCWDKYRWNVLYKASTPKFQEGYKIVHSKHPEFNYICESDFKKDFISLMDIKNQYTMFAVDDNVFKNSFTFSSKEFIEFIVRDDIMALSLRMCPDITYCYTENRPTPPPFFNDDIYVWKWKDSGLLGDWSYPFSIDCTIFKTTDIYERVLSLPYANPNTFEGIFANQSWHKPNLVCFKESIILNNPVNKVQTVNGNRYGNISAEYINDKLLDGYVIDFNSFKGFKNSAPHQEIPLSFIKG